MSHRFLNPSDLHDPTPFGYSHTTCVPSGSELVFVSGQYGSRPDGSVASSDFSDQLQQAFHNLGLALAAHGLELGDVVQLRSYIVKLGFDELGALAQTIQRKWEGAPPTQTVLGVSALATPEILFEVEAIAARPGAGMVR